jgi:hypothetical protein
MSSQSVCCHYRPVSTNRLGSYIVRRTCANLQHHMASTSQTIPMAQTRCLQPPSACTLERFQSTFDLPSKATLDHGFVRRKLAEVDYEDAQAVFQKAWAGSLFGRPLGGHHVGCDGHHGAVNR